MAGGGWLEVKNFVEDSVRFFGGEDWSGEAGVVVKCEGSKGLREEGRLPLRLAKGEILTVRVPGWGVDRVLNRSGWVIPVGGELYRVGANYEWDELDEVPTEAGRAYAEGVLRSFTERPFEVVEHVAGVRPIVRNSQPVAGRWGEGGFFLNGLGSKGCTYAPGVAKKLVELVVDGREMEEELDVGALLQR